MDASSIIYSIIIGMKKEVPFSHLCMNSATIALRMLSNKIKKEMIVMIVMIVAVKTEDY